MAKAPNSIFTQDAPRGLTPEQADYAEEYNRVERDMTSLDRACALIDQLVLDAGPCKDHQSD